MTILYKSENHLSLIFSFRGTVWIAVLPFCILAVVISALIYVVSEDFTYADIYSIQLSFPKESGFETLTTLLSFLVVSRVGRSYERMWQARSMMSSCLQNGRDLAVLVATLSAGYPREIRSSMGIRDDDNDDDGNKTYVRIWHDELSQALCDMIYGLTKVMYNDELTIACVLGEDYSNHLFDSHSHTKSSVPQATQKKQIVTSEKDVSGNIEVSEMPLSQSGKEVNDLGIENNDDGDRDGEILIDSSMLLDPFLLANKVHLLINNHSLYLGRTMEVQREMELHRQVSDFMMTYYDLLKYASTPVPFPTTQMAQTILLVWVCLLPSILLYSDDNDKMALGEGREVNVVILAIVAFLGTYGFWGLERVAEELDLPFGDDDNDIEIDELAKKITRDIKANLTYEYDHVKIDYEDGKIPNLVPLPSSLMT